MSERVVHRTGIGRPRAAWTAALLLGALAAIIAACGGADFTSGDDGAGGSTGGGSDVTATSGSVGGAGGMAPECKPPGDGACAQCMLEECTEPACACWANDDCVGIYACYAETCPGSLDDGCMKTCLNDHGDGVSLAALANDCALSHCTVACDTNGNALNECELCTYTECAEQINACYGFHVCFDLVVCLDNCGRGDESCAQDCKTQFPAGEDPLAAAIECAYSKCPQCN